jgi:predicted AAA+ superfamily ATPase
MKRALLPHILKDLNRKLVFISGPRQVGKTTLARSLFKSFEYFNYDNDDHRLALKAKEWDRHKPLLIFDELHKMKDWKRWLKGIYDVESIPPRILVTGSANLTTYQKVGDSLAGRFYGYRLHPIDLKEATLEFSPQDAFKRIMTVGGFPEPFLLNDSSEYLRWRKSHLDIILRQDFVDLYAVQDIQAIETMIALLRRRVGSTVSYSNLARDLEKDPNTIKRWLQLAENLLIIFRVSPYSQNIARSLLKEPKYYFYDTGSVVGDDGQRLENLVAGALLKECHRLEDTLGLDTAIHFLRTKEGREIDFLVAINGIAEWMIEVKVSDDAISPQFQFFSKFFDPLPRRIQLVQKIKREKTFPTGEEIRNVIPWLASFSFEN